MTGVPQTNVSLKRDDKSPVQFHSQEGLEAFWAFSRPPGKGKRPKREPGMFFPEVISLLGKPSYGCPGFEG